jgi:hypothetical protein
MPPIALAGFWGLLRKEFPGLLPKPSVTAFVAPVTVLPNTSWIVTSTVGLIGGPGLTLLGCTVNASFAAAAGEIESTRPGAAIRPVAWALSA